MPPTMLQFRSVVKVPSQSQDLSKVQKETTRELQRQLDEAKRRLDELTTG
jgi:hypothetical protein